MTGERRILFGVILLSLLAIATGLTVVTTRQARPEWREYQMKGIRLRIQLLENKLTGELSEDNRKKLLQEIQSWKSRTPEIIEVTPFGGKLPLERCLTCHLGIEDLSPSHPNEVFGCVICHGGMGSDLTTKGAHRGLRGGRNPATLDLAAESCGGRGKVGQCHADRELSLLNRVVTVPRSLMATNAGIIGILRFQWGLEPTSFSQFGIRAVSDESNSLSALPTEKDDTGKLHLAESHFRKFCGSCHLWNARYRTTMSRLAGCPACHAPYHESGRYFGGDPTIPRNEPGHVSTHSITNRIPNDRCRACHNRSARIGLNYHGQMESSQYGTPFVRGGLDDEVISEDRFILRLVPDIHHEKGMGCIDCHTAQDTMGDGKVHQFMKDQIEIRCEDCHGNGYTPPRTTTVNSTDPLIRALLRTSPFLKLSDGDTILVTSKGRPLPHIRVTEKGVWLTSKLTGKEHPVTVISSSHTDHPIVRSGDSEFVPMSHLPPSQEFPLTGAHRIHGHKRMECDACHSAWSPQCYGCHQLLDSRYEGMDHLTGAKSPGRWVEGRGYFRFSRNILGINGRGGVGILVPGCQVWNTILDKDGKVIGNYDSRIMKLRNGLTSIAVGSTHPHTTRREVPRCIDCHLDPKSLGLGDGRVGRNSGEKKLRFTSVYDSVRSGLGFDFSLDSVVDTDGQSLQSTSHQLARGFNQEELERITNIAPCLPCHDRYDDPIWARPGPYHKTSACEKPQGKGQERR